MRRSLQGGVVVVDRDHRVPPYRPSTNMVNESWFNSAVEVLFLSTGLIAGIKGGSSWLDMVNGRPWSNWNLVLVFGAVALIAAALLMSHSRRRSAGHWDYILAVFGCALLGSFYVPATVLTMRSYLSPNPELFGWSDLAVALFGPVLVLLSSVVSVVALVLASRKMNNADRS